MTFTPIVSIHIAAATIGLISAFMALLSRKGSRLHRRPGNLFFISMLIMSASGAYLGLIKSSIIDVVAGLWVFYLVASGWLTVVRKEGEIGPLEYGFLLIALADVTGASIYGWEAAKGATTLEDKAPAIACLVFGSTSFLAAAFDIRMLIRGGVSGAQRIARHLWRLCLASLFASISFFLPTRFSLPEAIVKTHLNLVPIIFIAASMIFWLARVHFTNAYKKTGEPAVTAKPSFARPVTSVVSQRFVA